MHKKLIVLVVLLFIFVVGGIWTLVNRSGSAKEEAYTFVDNNTQDESSVTEYATPIDYNDAELNKIIADWAAQYPFDASVTVRELSGGLKVANYKPTTSMVPASTYKLYVAYAVLHEIEQGKYTLSTVTKDGNTILTGLEQMILNSSNDTATTLGNLVGWKNINALLKTIGIESTDVNNYLSAANPTANKSTTATDLTTLLEKLYGGTLLNESNTKLLLNLMKNQKYRERVPSGVPTGVTVADKPGWLYGDDEAKTVVQNDAAIVYGPKSTYILVITTNGRTTTPLADLSKLVYDHLQQ